MSELITNNPYRILGVYSDATPREITTNTNKIKRYLEINKFPNFPIDNLCGLPKPTRTSESVERAESLIHLTKDKLYYALFWFPKDETLELYKGIEFLSKSDYSSAVEKYSHFIHNLPLDSYIKSLADSLGVDTFSLMCLFLDGLYTFVQGKTFFNLCKTLNSKEQEYAKDKVMSTPLSIINASISTAKNSIESEQTPSNILKIASKLIEDTKDALSDIKNLLGETDMQYQMVADNLAIDILQYGINYFNNTDDDDKIENALKIQKYALDIAMGSTAKNRCKDNVDILLKQKEDAPPVIAKSEVTQIMNTLKDFAENNKSIKHALDLLNNTDSQLKLLRRKLGRNNKFYLKISTLIANAALSSVIDEVNHIMKQLDKDVIDRKVEEKFMVQDIFGIKDTSPFYSKSRILSNLIHSSYLLGSDPKEEYRRKLITQGINSAKNKLPKAWEVIQHIDSMHKEKDFKEGRYKENRNVLKKICDEFSVPAEYKYQHNFLYAIICLCVVGLTYLPLLRYVFNNEILVSLIICTLPFLVIFCLLFAFMHYIEEKIYL